MDKVYINGKFTSQKMTGVQRYAAEITGQLLPQGNSRLVVPPDNLLQQVYQLQPAEVAGTKGGVYWEQVQLPAYLRNKRKPLLLNLCNIAPLLYGNKITCVHDVSYALNPQFYSKGFYYYYKLMMPRIIKGSRHIVTVSNFSKEALMRLYKLPDSGVTVIPNAASRALDAIAAGKTLQPPIDRPYFLFVGSMDPRKNLLLLLEAYVQAGISNVDLLIVGGKFRAFSEKNAGEMEQYQQNPQIHFYGAATDEVLAACYQHAQALVIPSLYEGFGLPLVEAFKFGCPVLASDIPVFREVAETHATYFDPYNKNAFVEVLRAAAGSVKPNMLAASEFVARKYSWEKSGKMMRQLLERYS
ncbi:glycosyltransferase family 4 protein [Deminuibacter soli]|nr:glycosyltransferase family 1 protein [Deminuibacter soli]